MFHSEWLLCSLITARGNRIGKTNENLPGEMCSAITDVFQVPRNIVRNVDGGRFTACLVVKNGCIRKLIQG